MIVLFQGRCALRDQLSDALAGQGLKVWAVEDNTGARNVLTREGWRTRVLVVDHAFVSARKARWFVDKALDYTPSGWLIHLVEDAETVTGLPGIVCRRDAPWAIVEVTAALAKSRSLR